MPPLCLRVLVGVTERAVANSNPISRCGLLWDSLLVGALACSVFVIILNPTGFLTRVADVFTLQFAFGKPKKGEPP